MVTRSETEQVVADIERIRLKVRLLALDLGAPPLTKGERGLIETVLSNYANRHEPRDPAPLALDLGAPPLTKGELVLIETVLFLYVNSHKPRDPAELSASSAPGVAAELERRKSGPPQC